jgi:hypothetical protein
MPCGDGSPAATRDPSPGAPIRRDIGGTSPFSRVWLRVRATVKGVELGHLVNELLRRDIDLIEAVN